MVSNPRAPSRARAIKPLNAPAQLEVREDGRGRPVSLAVGGNMQPVASIEDTWKINDEWWRGPGQEIERVYFEVLLADGRRVTLFHDLVSSEWFRQ